MIIEFRHVTVEDAVWVLLLIALFGYLSGQNCRVLRIRVNGKSMFPVFTTDDGLEDFLPCSLLVVFSKYFSSGAWSALPMGVAAETMIGYF
jgi:hypothetical protein